jgi:transposase
LRLTDEQWKVVRGLLPGAPRRADRRGRRCRDARTVLEGILWVLRTGAPWHALPEHYPSYQTCHRRFQHWVHSEALRRLRETLPQDLYERSAIDVEECFIDGSFAPAKKRRPGVGKGKRGKGTKLMAVADAEGLPLAAHVASASPDQVALVRATLEERFVVEPPVGLIGDMAYDRDRLDHALREDGIELIAAHRPNGRHILTCARRH